jgi:nitroimidazol reductase NimA-like FMN-containing flavoprotein (pyridoxamine 5'-phosphate oxidase superfamily)
MGDEFIFGRTSAGTKLLTLQHHPWVAFEVDEVISPFNWKSVVVHGTFMQLQPTHSSSDLRTYESALRAFESKFPSIFTSDDPFAFRNVIFAVSINDMIGRRAKATDER